MNSNEHGKHSTDSALLQLGNHYSRKTFDRYTTSAYVLNDRGYYMLVGA